MTYKENYIRILTRENKWHSADYQDATARLVVGCLCGLVFFPGCAPLDGEGLRIGSGLTGSGDGRFVFVWWAVVSYSPTPWRVQYHWRWQA